jgi:hypothetical protein
VGKYDIIVYKLIIEKGFCTVIDTLDMEMALERFKDDDMEQRNEAMTRRLSRRDPNTSPDDNPKLLFTDQEDFKKTLSEDTFSFLIVAPTFSLSFLTGVLVVGVKTTMYSLILADMMTKGTPNNLLGIPASLELPVIVSQVLAVASKYDKCC